MTADQHQLGNLLAAAGEYTKKALSTLSPQTGARVAAARLYVTVGTMPAVVRLVVEGDQEALACVHEARDADLPPVLCAAAAAVIESGVGRLSDAARKSVAMLQEQGRGLGLIVDLEAGAVHLMVDVGEALPRVLATLRFEPAVTH